MTTTRVKLKVGGLELEYEGPVDFLRKGLPALVSHLSTLETPGQDPAAGAHKPPPARGGGKDAGPLASFLKARPSLVKQNQRFLGTAVWLHLKGSQLLTTGDVRKAYSSNQCGKLTNPGQCLIDNKRKGYCVPDGKSFYVSDEGKTVVG